MGKHKINPMKFPTAFRNPQLAYQLLLFVIAFTFLIVWLPFLRAPFDGVTYHWATTYFGIPFSGSGLNRDYLFLIVEFIFYAGLFFSVYWVRNRNVFYVLLGLWWFHFFGGMLYTIIQDPDSTFRGDTLGVVVSLIYIVGPLVLIALTLVVWVIRKDRQAEEVSIPWNRKNRLMALLIFGPLPLQFVLLHFGPDPSLMDQIGVLISITQCLAIPLVLRPYLSAHSA